MNTVENITQIIVSIICCLILCACNGAYNASVDLSTAKTLLDTDPNKAIAMLDSLNSNATPKESSEIFYLRAKAKLNLLDYPAAMEAFLNAEKLAEQSNNDSILALSRQGMMILSDSIYDYHKKILYALKACRVYEKYDDYDNIYDILSQIADIDSDLNFNEFTDEIKYYSQLMNDNDTVIYLPYNDSITKKRGEIIYRRLQTFGSIHIQKFRFVDGLTKFDKIELITAVKTNNGWKEYILNDSSDISIEDAYSIAKELRRQGYNNEAKEFIDFYSNNYAEKKIEYTHDTITLSVRGHIVARVTNRKNKQLRKLYQSDVNSAINKFYYEEELRHKYTIHTQKILVIVISIACLAIIIAVCLYVHLKTIKRQRREDEYMRIASELQAALINVEELHLSTLTHLCNTYYESRSIDSINSKTARDARKAIMEIAKSDEITARLETHLDNTSEGALSLLRAELPQLKSSDYKLFMYNALHLSIPAICLLLDESREVIYNRRLRLRAKIQESDALHKDTFLRYLK